MINLEEIHIQLETLGLTHQEALLYVSLVQNGDLRIHQLCHFTQIPRSSVYEVVNELVSLGLITEVVKDKYKVFQAYPLSHLNHHIQEQVSNLNYLSKSIPDIESKLASVKNSSPPQTAVRSYIGRNGARQIFWNSLKTNSTVYVYSEFGRSQYLGNKFYTNFVEESTNSDIQEKVLISPTKHAVDLIVKDNGSSLSRTQISNIRYSEDINVKGETLIYDNTYAQVYLSTSEIHGFEINDSNFIHTQRSIFEALWDHAIPVENLISSKHNKP